jgi:hypothetical protein
MMKMVINRQASEHFNSCYVLCNIFVLMRVLHMIVFFIKLKNCTLVSKYVVHYFCLMNNKNMCQKIAL